MKPLIPRKVKTSWRTIVARAFTKHNILKFIVGLIITLVVLPLLIYWHITSLFTGSITTDMNALRDTRVGIVFGASASNGKASPALEERLIATVKLYKAGKIKKVLVTGDARTREYDETQVMTDYLIKQGIPSEDIKTDGAGNRTYDSCYRARQVFGLQEAILITQQFHLYRAMYLCTALGIDSHGFIADQRNVNRTEEQVRDFFALLLAVWEVNISPPQLSNSARIVI